MTIKESTHKNEYEGYLEIIKDEKIRNDLGFDELKPEELDFLEDIKDPFLKILDKLAEHEDEHCYLVDFLTNILNRASAYPIVDVAHEWYLNGIHKRFDSIHKMKNGGMYNTHAIMFYENVNHTAFFGEVEGINSRQTIKCLPFEPRRFDVEVALNRKGNYAIKDKKMARSAIAYYNQETYNNA